MHIRLHWKTYFPTALWPIQLKYVSLHYLDAPRDSRGVSKNSQFFLQIKLLSSCAKIVINSKNLKNVKKRHFFDIFSKFLSFGPNFSAPNYQIQTQWMILLLHTSVGPRASKYLYLKNISAVLWMVAPT